MTLVDDRRQAPPRPPQPVVAPRSRPRRGATFAWCAMVGVGMGLVVGLDGTPLWRVARVLAVAGVCLPATVWATLGTRRASAVASVLLGTVATPVGATIAYSYLQRTGLSPRAGGGVLTFAGGMALLVAGAVVLVVAARGRRRLLAVPIALVAASVVVLPIYPAVYATNVPRPALGSVTPAHRGLSFVDAAFTTSDGVRLSGWYIPSTDGSAVVLLHGASSTRSHVLDQAVVLARHGFGVLLFDTRGHGRSGGRAMDFGWYGDTDVAAAVTWLAGRPDVDAGRIGAVGLSMGGEEAIGALARDPRIRAVVAEGATNRTSADKAWLADEYGLRGRIQLGIEWLTYALTDLLTAARPPISLRDAVVAAAPRPVLLIAAGAVADEQRAGEAIAAASPSSVELWVVPGAGHTGGLRTRPEEWARRVSGFLARALAP